MVDHSKLECQLHFLSLKRPDGSAVAPLSNVSVTGVMQLDGEADTLPRCVNTDRATESNCTKSASLWCAARTQETILLS